MGHNQWFFNVFSGSELFQPRIPWMAKDLTRSMFGFDLICAHPWNPWQTGRSFEIIIP
jgi:hypothetical protein